MAELKGKAETSSHRHTKEVTMVYTTNPENVLKTAEQTTYTWGRGEDHTEKDEVVEL